MMASETIYAVAIFIGIFCVEFILSTLYWKPYFKFGVPIWIGRTDEDINSDITMASILSNDEFFKRHYGFSLKAVSESEIAVREVRHGSVKAPTVHGIVRLEAHKKRIKFILYLNWSILLLPVLIFGLARSQLGIHSIVVLLIISAAPFYGLLRFKNFIGKILGK